MDCRGYQKESGKGCLDSSWLANSHLQWILAEQWNETIIIWFIQEISEYCPGEAVLIPSSGFSNFNEEKSQN